MSVVVHRTVVPCERPALVSFPHTRLEVLSQTINGSPTDYVIQMLVLANKGGGGKGFFCPFPPFWGGDKTGGINLLCNNKRGALIKNRPFPSH